MKNQVAEIKVFYSTKNIDKQKIVSSEAAFQVLLGSWNKGTLELQEEFKVLLLNRANKVLGVYQLSKGGITGTVVDLKILFAVVLKCVATGIILCHNHPGGTLTPSENDKIVTQRIKQVGDLLDITIIDHLIITTDGYYSFSEHGIL